MQDTIRRLPGEPDEGMSPVTEQVEYIAFSDLYEQKRRPGDPVAMLTPSGYIVYKQGTFLDVDSCARQLGLDQGLGVGAFGWGTPHDDFIPMIQEVFNAFASRIARDSDKTVVMTSKDFYDSTEYKKLKEFADKVKEFHEYAKHLYSGGAIATSVLPSELGVKLAVVYNLENALRGRPSNKPNENLLVDRPKSGQTPPEQYMSARFLAKQCEPLQKKLEEVETTSWDQPSKAALEILCNRLRNFPNNPITTEEMGQTMCPAKSLITIIGRLTDENRILSTEDHSLLLQIANRPLSEEEAASLKTARIPDASSTMTSSKAAPSAASSSAAAAASSTAPAATSEIQTTTPKMDSRLAAYKRILTDAAKTLDARRHPWVDKFLSFLSAFFTFGGTARAHYRDYGHWQRPTAAEELRTKHATPSPRPR